MELKLHVLYGKNYDHYDIYGEFKQKCNFEKLGTIKKAQQEFLPTMFQKFVNMSSSNAEMSFVILYG